MTYHNIGELLDFITTTPLQSLIAYYSGAFVLGKLLAHLIGFEIRSDKISLNPRIIISLSILQLTMITSDSIVINWGINQPESYLLAALIIIGLCAILHSAIFGFKITLKNTQHNRINIPGLIGISTIIQVILKLRERDSRSQDKSIDLKKVINDTAGTTSTHQHNLEEASVTLIASFPFIMAMYMTNPVYGIVSHLLAASIIADSISLTVNNAKSPAINPHPKYLK